MSPCDDLSIRCSYDICLSIKFARICNRFAHWRFPQMCSGEFINGNSLFHLPQKRLNSTVPFALTVREAEQC